MYGNRSTFLAALVFLPSLFTMPATAQSLNEVLAGVSKNVQEFQDLLPDFVCNETVTSTTFDSGRVIKQKVVESIFTGAQRASEENRVRFAFTESREVITIDGKAVPKGTSFPKLPYRFSGGFSSLLITTFAPDSLQHHNFSLADRLKSGDSSAVLVQFSTKEDQQNLRALIQGKRLAEKDVGAAWIDQTSFIVLRLQRKSLNLPRALSRSFATADYGPVRIGERQFWMPIRIRAEVTERDTRASATYVAEYSDCRKFTTDIKLLP